MIPKKTIRANLEKWKSSFILLGLVIALGLTYLAFEYKKEDLKSSNIQVLKDLAGETEIIPITRQELQKQAEPPKPKQVIIDLKIVDDDIKLEDNLDFDAFDADQEDAIIIQNLIANKQKEEEPEEDPTFLIVESMPLFQGGDINTFRNWVQLNLIYPTVAIENQVSGTVYVTFIVGKDGNIDPKGITILRGVDPLLDKEVIRILTSSPKWTPGKQREVPVKVSFSIPVKFILQ